MKGLRCLPAGQAIKTPYNTMLVFTANEKLVIITSVKFHYG